MSLSTRIPDLLTWCAAHDIQISPHVLLTVDETTGLSVRAQARIPWQSRKFDLTRTLLLFGHVSIIFMAAAHRADVDRPRGDPQIGRPVNEELLSVGPDYAGTLRTRSAACADTGFVL